MVGSSPFSLKHVVDHAWYKPEDEFGPIAGLRRCSKCKAKFFILYYEKQPPESGCPAEADKYINHNELFNPHGE